MKRFHIIILAVLAAGAFSSGCIRIAIWYGFVPCNHGCYWCGKPLEEKR